MVVYNTMQSFMAQEGAVDAGQYALAVAAVAVVVFGGAFIGVVFGFVTAFITKFTTDVRGQWSLAEIMILQSTVQLVKRRVV